MKIIKITAVWCPGCLLMNKTFKKIKEQYPDIEIESYDYDIDEEEIKKYNIGNLLPVTIFINNDKEVSRLIGERNFEEIERELSNIE